MPVGSDARLGSFGYEFQACGTCLEIASRLQRIFSHPTDQGAALQTNHPPSISLPDWQPGIWRKTKSVNNNRVSKMHILHMKNVLRAHTASDLCFTCQFENMCCNIRNWMFSLFYVVKISFVAYGVKWRWNGRAKQLNMLLRFKLTEILSAFQLEMSRSRKDGIQIERENSESYPVDRFRVVFLHNNLSSCRGALRCHANVLIFPIYICNCTAAQP